MWPNKRDFLNPGLVKPSNLKPPFLQRVRIGSLPGSSAAAPPEAVEPLHLHKVQDNVEEALRRVVLGPVLTGSVAVRDLRDPPAFKAPREHQLGGGVLLVNVTLSKAQDNLIEHGLGKILAGWLVVGANGPGHVWDSPNNDTIGNPGRFYLLNTDQPGVVVNLLVF